MFPYQFKKRAQKNQKNSKLKNATTSVKKYYYNAYDTILKLVKKQNYRAPQGYSKSQWKKVMIKLQCMAFLNLKKLVTQGLLGKGKMSDMQLSCLNGYDSPGGTTINWHEIYMKHS